MRNRKHKWISGLLILAMLISGICFGERKADPVLACAPAQTADSRIAAADNVSGQTVACILPVKSIPADEQLYTEETSGFRINAGLGRSPFRPAGQRREAGISLGFLCQNFFSLRKGGSYTDFDRVCSAGISGEESVANYLHRSDGKKRI